MRLPRGLTGRELVRAPRVQGYAVTRRTGSHIRLTTTEHGEHHVPVPDHDPLGIGTLAGIPGDVAAHFELSREDLMKRLFDSN